MTAEPIRTLPRTLRTCVTPPPIVESETDCPPAPSPPCRRASTIPDTVIGSPSRATNAPMTLPHLSA